MIARYTRPEMGALWTDEARMEAWRLVEVAAAEELDGPDRGGPAAIRAATFTVQAVQEREAVTDHDVAAFVDVLARLAPGPAGRWIHFGLTSSDVLDTALALQLTRAGALLVAGARELVDALAARAREHVDTVCVGRTHGIHAEPTTFGLKLAGLRLRGRTATLVRLERAVRPGLDGARSRARSGPTRASARTSSAASCTASGCAAEPVSTQVVPRDRHAELLQAIALAGAGLERFATEIRHLQRTEVREAEEPFRAGAQKGSSAMPHKRNPITSERISRPGPRPARRRPGRPSRTSRCGTSATSRTPPPSASSCPTRRSCSTTSSTSALRLAAGMVVHPDRMRANLDLTHGALFSQRVLLALVAQGRPRDDAYRITQQAAQQAWDTRHAAARPPRRDATTSSLDLDDVFDLRTSRATRARSSRGSTPSPEGRLT